MAIMVSLGRSGKYEEKLPIHEAAIQGDVSSLMEFAQGSPDTISVACPVKGRKSNCGLPLHIALRRSMFWNYQSCGNDSNNNDNDNNNNHHKSPQQEQQYQCFQLLLAHTDPLDEPDYQGETALHLAIRHNLPWGLMHLLLQALKRQNLLQSNIMAQDYLGRTPLYHAQSTQRKCLQQILQYIAFHTSKQILSKALLIPDTIWTGNLPLHTTIRDSTLWPNQSNKQVVTTTTTTTETTTKLTTYPDALAFNVAFAFSGVSPRTDTLYNNYKNNHSKPILSAEEKALKYIKNLVRACPAALQVRNKLGLLPLQVAMEKKRPYSILLFLAMSDSEFSINTLEAIVSPLPSSSSQSSSSPSPLLFFSRRDNQQDDIHRINLCFEYLKKFPDCMSYTLTQMTNECGNSNGKNVGQTLLDRIWSWTTTTKTTTTTKHWW